MYACMPGSLICWMSETINRKRRQDKSNCSSYQGCRGGRLPSCCRHFHQRTQSWVDSERTWNIGDKWHSCLPHGPYADPHRWHASLVHPHSHPSLTFACMPHIPTSSLFQSSNLLIPVLLLFLSYASFSTSSFASPPPMLLLPQCCVLGESESSQNAPLLSCPFLFYENVLWFLHFYIY